jgi:hypothetical protein
MTVVLPSGIFKTRSIRATVPKVFISFASGSSTPSAFWETTPITLDPLFASFISLIDLSLPAVIGITTPGNKTVLRSGNIASKSGNCSLLIASSSSGVINGINSASSFNSWNDKLSISIIFDLAIVLFSHCVISKNSSSNLLRETYFTSEH